MSFQHPRRYLLTACLVVFVLVLIAAVSAKTNNNKKHIIDSTSVIDMRENNPFSYVAVCLIVKEDVDLREFIDYHYRLGIDKFYLYDNNSTEPLINTILDHVQTGVVSYTYIAEHKIPSIQPYVYQKCFREHYKQHQFLAFIDADEFITIPSRERHGLNTTIPQVLREFEKYGGVLLPWKFFGSSGHLKRPKGGILQNYNRCFHYPSHWKTIANVKYVEQPSGVNPHFVQYKDGFYPVYPDHRRSEHLRPGKFNKTNHPNVFGKIYISHYSLKSHEDFATKIKRGRATTKIKRSMDMFVGHDGKATHNCSMPKMPPPRW